MIELNKIYNMDCLEGMKEIPDGSVDLVLIDPPYGIDFKSGRSKNKEYRDNLKSVNGILNDKDNIDFLCKTGGGIVPYTER